MTDLLHEEKRIIRDLQESDYLSINYEKIANAEKIPVEEAKKIVKKLEDEKIITGYSALIDAEKIGFITVFIHFDADKTLEDMAGKVKNLADKGGFNITDIFIITGDRDLHIKVKVKGLEGYYQFVKEFEHLVSLTGTGTGIIGYVKIKEDPRILVV